MVFKGFSFQGIDLTLYTFFWCSLFLPVDLGFLLPSFLFILKNFLQLLCNVGLLISRMRVHKTLQYLPEPFCLRQKALRWPRILIPVPLYNPVVEISAQIFKIFVNSVCSQPWKLALFNPLEFRGKIFSYLQILKLFKVVLSKGRSIYLKDSSNHPSNPNVEENNRTLLFHCLKIFNLVLISMDII